MHKFNIQDNNSENVSGVNDLQMFPNLLILDSSSSVFCPKFYMHYYPYHTDNIVSPSNMCDLIILIMFGNEYRF